MKSSILFICSVALIFACSPKTEETSKYADYISELKRFQVEIDSLHQAFKGINVEEAVTMSQTADEKYNRVKQVYEAKEIDLEYEKIMLLTRGQLIKKLRTVKSDQKRISGDYELCKKKYLDLKEDLINEAWEDDKATIFFNEERNAQIILNAELTSFVSNVSSSLEIAPKLYSQLDSIIAVHEK